MREMLKCLKLKWAQEGSNLRPTGYEPASPLCNLL